MGMPQLSEINHSSFPGAGYCQTLNFKWLETWLLSSVKWIYVKGNSLMREPHQNSKAVQNWLGESDRYGQGKTECWNAIAKLVVKFINTLQYYKTVILEVISFTRQKFLATY